MRAVFASLVLASSPLVAGCEAEVAPGTYLCGPEELCPEGLACNGPDNICVAPTKQQPFECSMMNKEVPGDDTPATAQGLGDMACVSLVRETRGCLPLGDIGDFYTFRVVDGCTNVKVQASIVYPVAFQSLTMQLGKAGETPVTLETPCAASRAHDEGEAVACLEAPVAPGSYVLSVIPDGTGQCDNACKFNRYGLAVQVTTP